ncbi:MAG: TonB-dependent receptor plug domain-containing protein, partial [Bacteroidota bacterium]
MKQTLLLLICLVYLDIQAQDTLYQKGITTDSITIEATRLRDFTNSTPRSVNKISASQFQQGQQELSLTESLVGIPGLLSTNGENFAQDMRLSIRGFGARAPFGIRGIKLVVDGFIFSTPDGQGQVDNIDPGILSGAEILRGPSSGLYGNASGGVVSFSTDFPKEGLGAKVGLSTGAFGLQRYQARLSRGTEKTQQMIYGS